MYISFFYTSIWSHESCHASLICKEWQLSGNHDADLQDIMNTIFAAGNDGDFNADEFNDHIVTSLSVGDEVQAFFNDESYTGIIKFKVLNNGFEILKSKISMKLEYYFNPSNQ